MYFLPKQEAPVQLCMLMGRLDCGVFNNFIRNPESPCACVRPYPEPSAERNEAKLGLRKIPGPIGSNGLYTYRSVGAALRSGNIARWRGASSFLEWQTSREVILPEALLLPRPRRLTAKRTLARSFETALNSRRVLSSSWRIGGRMMQCRRRAHTHTHPYNNAMATSPELACPTSY